jgi:hypothetical protein
MACRVCGGSTFGSICGRCKGEIRSGDEYALNEHARRKAAHQAMLSAIRWLVRQDCLNGTVDSSCQCPVCQARMALAYYESVP